MRFTRGFNEPGAIRALFSAKTLSLPTAGKQGFLDYFAQAAIGSRRQAADAACLSMFYLHDSDLFA
jgi:hypothetical protein